MSAWRTSARRQAVSLHPRPTLRLARPSWLERASDLLAEDDPGPTPWLVRGVIVDRAITAAVGRWKTTKTYALLDIAISVVTGLAFLGRHIVPDPGSVVLVLEESGRQALWRRLDSLCRGRAIDCDALADLHFAANRRVKLDEAEWQQDILAAGKELQPRAFILDPLARLKRPGRDENAQKEYAVLIEFMRLLRDETGAAVIFVQHTGHQGEHMRGTSDLESVWESRLAFRRDDRTISIKSEHREAEDSDTAISYRLAWDELTRTIRLDPVEDPLDAKVTAYLADHPDASGNEVYKALKGNGPRSRQKAPATTGTRLRYHLGTTPLGHTLSEWYRSYPSPYGRGCGYHLAKCWYQKRSTTPRRRRVRARTP
jgi:AAA domain-containing protein